MKIVNYSELIHMGEIHSKAGASSPYELVQNSFRHSFNNNNNNNNNNIIIIIIIIITY